MASTTFIQRAANTSQVCCVNVNSPCSSHGKYPDEKTEHFRIFLQQNDCEVLISADAVSLLDVSYQLDAALIYSVLQFNATAAAFGQAGDIYN